MEEAWHLRSHLDNNLGRWELVISCETKQRSCGKSPSQSVTFTPLRLHKWIRDRSYTSLLAILLQLLTAFEN
ncbi:hypothetical protein J6590_078568 [Homalodisca vitripennis]|nr:hypothetical protein J6590_078568 [Homalodisca vitripennis]